MGVLLAYMPMYHIVVCSAHGGDKRVSDPLGLEFQTVVSHLGGARSPTWALSARAVCALTLNHHSSLLI